MIDKQKLSELGLTEPVSSEPRGMIVRRYMIQITTFPNGKEVISSWLADKEKRFFKKKKPMKPAVVLGDAKTEAVNLLEGFKNE